MITPVPGAPTPFPIARENSVPESGGGVQVGAAAERSEGNLDTPEHSGTITAAIGGTLAPVVALIFNHPVIFTLNQYTPRRHSYRDGSLSPREYGSSRLDQGR
jgi:hypothetical protein